MMRTFGSLTLVYLIGSSDGNSHVLRSGDAGLDAFGLTTSPSMITEKSDHWYMTGNNSQLDNGWAMKISNDDYTFQSSLSTISIEIDGSNALDYDDTKQLDIFFGIGDGSKYISYLWDFDGAIWAGDGEQSEAIWSYPACSQGMPSGDVSTLLDGWLTEWEEGHSNYNRFWGLRAALSGGDPDNWSPFSHEFNGDTWPVTLEITNDVENNQVTFRHHSSSLDHSCTFDGAFQTDTPITMGLMPDIPDDAEITSITLSRTVIQDASFIFVDTQTDRASAAAYCANTYGTTLATIRNQEDADALYNLKEHHTDLKDDMVWIWTGLQKSDGDTGYEWDSGYPCDGDCVADWWRPGYPDGTGDCIFVMHGREWEGEGTHMLRDYPCSTSFFYFACDKEAFPTLSPSPSPITLSRTVSGPPTCSASICAHGDNSLEIWSSTDGAAYVQVADTDDWDITAEVELTDITGPTTLRFQVDDNDHRGGLLATVRVQCDDGYDRTILTDDGNSNFDVVYSSSGNTVMSVFHRFGFTDSDNWDSKVNAEMVQCMDTDAYWMWNGVDRDNVNFELDLFPEEYFGAAAAAPMVESHAFSKMSSPKAIERKYEDVVRDTQPEPWTVTVTGKDLVILALIAINLCVCTALCSVVKGAGNGKRGKYEAVGVISHSEMEEIAV